MHEDTSKWVAAVVAAPDPEWGSQIAGRLVSRSQVFSVLNGVRGRRAGGAAGMHRNKLQCMQALRRPRRRSLIGPYTGEGKRRGHQATC